MNVLMKSLMVTATLFIVSCNNDDSIECPEAITGELTTTETAFAGSWVLTGLDAEDAIDITDDNTENPSTDIFAQYTECQRDLVYDFVDNRNYVFKQAQSATDCEGKQSLTGTWSLTDKVLAFVSGCSTQTIEIEVAETDDVFTYEALVNIREVSGLIKNTKVTFTFEKVQA
ncbi:uncharacterized protein DUF5004 [Gelidibacter sediminis]|uniref:Uncharacterized protein DUF5004 n=2 Tax=Gelidibacter sediminis TaxID=1608710 RepID=A0A4V6Q4P9_9FLAO|nr:uncharacterized protein DUF5004 [Gelidibacter sediminis]